jgi:hypothetical protein
MKKIFKIFIFIFFTFASVNIFFIYSISAKEEFSIIVTSNLGGRFSVNEGDYSKDFMLTLAQSILAERKARNADIYIDLGNAFYPGLLSKYSYGSVMMDFFNFFSCNAVLISSKDLRIGIDNLQFLSSGKNINLLSANIIRDGKILFNPYLIYTKKNTSIAFAAISSKKINFDIAEKNLYKIEMKNETEILNQTIQDLKSKSINHIVLLSGLSIKDTISLLSQNKQIQLAMCGGDNTADLFSDKASRIDLADGRSVLLLPGGDVFYSLGIQADTGISISNFKRITPVPVKTNSQDYTDFANRLALWKEKFRAENEQLIARTGEKKIIINDEKLLSLLRDKFNAEIAVAEQNTILDSEFSGNIKRRDLLNAINSDYNIFIFNMKGIDLKSIADMEDSILISGITAGRIQGYPVDDKRSYRIAATQPAFEKIENYLQKEITYRNSWNNITDIIYSDIKENHVILKQNYNYLERNFRTTLDLYLSNFFENNSVRKGDSIEAPVGQSEYSNKRWGMENKIDLTVYNRYHQFIFTPYMFYERQDENYLNNLLRGTFIYNLNLYEIIKPYQKSQADTVIKEINGLRPVYIRETAGLNAVTETLQVKSGIGFEKYVHEPAKEPVYGLEFIVNYKLPFLNYFTYSFNADTFISTQSLEKTKRLIRSDIANVLSASVNQFLGISVKYRWFYYFSGEHNDRYENYQTIVSADLTTDFKIW